MPTTSPVLDSRGASATGRDVRVGGGVIDGEGGDVLVAGAGVNVAVAGGVTRSSSFCSGRMTEV